MKRKLLMLVLCLTVTVLPLPAYAAADPGGQNAAATVTEENTADTGSQNLESVFLPDANAESLKATESVKAAAQNDEADAGAADAAEDAAEGGSDEADVDEDTAEDADDAEETVITTYPNTMLDAFNLIGTTYEGIRLHWNKMAGVDGYYIYRRRANETKWSRVANITSDNILYWTNASVSGGNKYYYRVKGYKVNGEADAFTALPGDEKEVIIHLDPPETLELTRLTSTTYQVSWNDDEHADSYEIQVADNRFFRNASSIIIEGSNSVSTQIGRLLENEQLYVRIRSLRTKGSQTDHSAWRYTSSVTTGKTATLSYYIKKKKNVDLKELAGETCGAYDTMQGACSDGTFAYTILYNRNNNTCKITKVRLSNRKLVKVSGILSLHHGNDMTYNADTNQLAIVHYSGYTKRVTFVDPSTLKVVKSKDVVIPSSLYGATAAQLSAITGFSGIAYDAENNRYVLAIKNSKALLITDENLNPVRYQGMPANGLTNQGLECTGDYILRAQSRNSGGYNTITVYDWYGNVLSNIYTNKSYELEHVFFAGDSLYAGYYTAYYTTKYKEVTVTTTKKTVTGKTKKVTTTKKVAYKALERSNYMVKLTGY